VENPTIILTFHPDTLELDVDAPELALDVVISFLQRAIRQCENAEKIVVAQQVSAAVKNIAMNEERTQRVISRIKM
jgi:hypothetical protein